MFCPNDGAEIQNHTHIHTYTHTHDWPHPNTYSAENAHTHSTPLTTYHSIPCGKTHAYYTCQKCDVVWIYNFEEKSYKEEK